MRLTPPVPSTHKTVHKRQIVLQPEALRLFFKQHKRIPYKLEGEVEIHRKCAHKKWISAGRTHTCNIASIEHEDKRIGHIFVL